MNKKILTKDIRFLFIKNNEIITNEFIKDSNEDLGRHHKQLQTFCML
jgi:hypothetical protein